MSEQRQLVARGVRSVRGAQCAAEISLRARLQAGRIRECFIQLSADRHVVEPGRASRRPGQLERGPSLQRLPKMLGDDDDSLRRAQHLAHPGHLAGRGVIDAGERCARHGRLRERCVQHPGKFDVDAKQRAAVALVRGVETRDAASDQREFRGGLELDPLRWRQPRGRGGKFAIGKLLAPGVQHAAFVGMALIRRDTPGRGRRADQQSSRRRAGHAQFLPGVAHAVAGAGDLSTVALIDVGFADGRRLDANGRERYVEFLRHQHGQRRVDALPHLGAIDEHRDRVVGADAQPGVDLVGGRIAGGGGGAGRSARRALGCAGRQSER